MSKLDFLIKNQNDHIRKLQASLNEYLSKVQDTIPVSDTQSLMEVYTQSIDYVTSTTRYHLEGPIIRFIASLSVLISPKDAIVDVGTCSGFTGFLMALAGKLDVTFYDYEGIGSDFIEYFIEQEDLAEQCRFLPYSSDNDKRKYDWVIALDVLEHTGNQLAFIKWLTNMGKNVAITYPMSIGFTPPWFKVVDDWVDDEAILKIIGDRYVISKNYTTQNRRFLVFHTR